MAHYALAIGMDTAQGRPGDALEYTAARAGRRSWWARPKKSLAVFEGSYSFVTDTPDFWRRQHEKYPEHGQRFTGEPAYFRHVTTAAQRLMEMTHTQASDYRYAVFHQPNVKFPQRAGKTLGFNEEQIKTGLLVGVIGNTYAGSAMIGLTAVLDEAQAGRPHPAGVVWLGRGFGCLCAARHRRDHRAAGASSQDARLHCATDRYRLCDLRPLARQAA